MLCPTYLITEDIIITIKEYRKEGKLGGNIACIAQVLILVKKYMHYRIRLLVKPHMKAIIKLCAFPIIFFLNL